MNEKRMAYEMIIRQANGNCGRWGVAGADANIFDGFLSTWSTDRDGKNNHSDYERGFAIGEISAFLRDAIERLQKAEGCSKETKNQLQVIYDNLLAPSFDDVISAIDEVEKIV